MELFVAYNIYYVTRLAKKTILMGNRVILF